MCVRACVLKGTNGDITDRIPYNCFIVPALQVMIYTGFAVFSGNLAILAGFATVWLIIFMPNMLHKESHPLNLFDRQADIYFVLLLLWLCESTNLTGLSLAVAGWIPHIGYYPARVWHRLDIRQLACP